MGETMMLRRPQILSFGVFAILASAVLVAAFAAQQDTDRRRMVEEVVAMLASAARAAAVWLSLVRVCAPQ